MSKLPYSSFYWLESSDFENINWGSIDTESDSGFILEVDLHYPKKLHKFHGDFPLAPENIQVEYNDLSHIMKEVLFNLENKSKYQDKKLVGTLRERINYVTHFKNLKLYLQLGMKITKIHRVLHFKQTAFIAPFIKKCTLLRQKSTTKFEQDQYKKVANCVYGKTIQNIRNYINVSLHTKVQNLLKAVSSITFKNFTILGENLVQTNHSQPFIIHNRPIYVGFTILELSKHFMFDFYYNRMRKGLQCEFDLGMSDTDSFVQG